MHEVEKLEWVGKGDAPAVQTMPFLLNICSNASSFLKHEEHGGVKPSGDFVNFTYEFRAARLMKNWVTVDPTTGEPAVRIRRSGDEVGPPPLDGKDVSIRPDIQKTLQDLNKQLCDAIVRSFQHQQLMPKELTNIDGAAGMGCVAHEIGTLAMRKMDCVEDREGHLPACSHSSAFSVDDQLGLDGTHNVFVSDLSVLPVSPPANPSLTLAALVLRLAHKLQPPELPPVVTAAESGAAGSSTVSVGPGSVISTSPTPSPTSDWQKLEKSTANRL
jgi:hypothetical protein